MDYEKARESEDTTSDRNEFTAVPMTALGLAGQGAVVLTPDANNVVVLPEGVSLDDIRVVGRNLVIDAGDGTRYIIPDGAIFVPQLVVDGVSVPPLNLAALLLGDEPQPAAGNPQSSGGNFADPVDPIQDAYARGDLLPYTELQFSSPEEEEIFLAEDREPEVGDNPPVQLDDDVLGGNPGGTGDDEDGINLSGVLSGSGGDGELTFALTGVIFPEGEGFAIASNDGETLIISQNGINVLQVVVDPATGEYAISQLAPIHHPEGAEENNLELTISYSVTDVDGDVANGTLLVNLDDDTPIIGENATVQLDDDALAGGNPGGVGDDPDSLNATGTLSGSTGADTPGTFALTGVTLPASGGFAIASNNGSMMVISQNGTNVLQIQVDSSTGDYAVTQLAPIQHPEGMDENNVQFTIQYSLTDSDGDVANGTLLIDVDDDTPVIGQGQEQGFVDEDELPGGNPDGDGVGTVASGSLAAIAVSVGADQPGSFGLSSDVSSLVAQGLTSQGSPLNYNVSGNVLTAYTGAAPGDGDVFTLTLQANGDYEFELLDQLDHLPNIPANNDDQTLEIDFSSLVVVADSDGDEISLPAGAFAIVVEDDIPTPAERGSVTGLVDEDDLPTGNDDNALGDDDPGNADGDNDGTTTGGAAGSLAALFSVGADEPLQNYALLSDTSSLTSQGLTSKGETIVYEVDGDTLTAYVEDGTTPGEYNGGEDRAVFTLQVNADGSWTFDLIDQLDHPLTDDPDTEGTTETAFEDNLLIDFSGVVSAEDRDGDAVTAAAGTFVVDVDDDLPVSFTPVDLTDETGSPPAQDDALINNGSASATRLLNDSDNNGIGEDFMGADGFGSLAFTGGSDGDQLMIDGSPATSGGADKFIYLVGYGTATLTAYIESGTTAGYQPGEDTATAFTVTLNPGTGNGDDATYTIDFDVAIDDGSSIPFDNLTSKAGNTNYRAVGADDAGTPVDLLLSASLSGGADTTVNTDSDSVGAQNNSVGAGQTVRIDFINDITTDLGNPTGFDFASHYSTNNYLGTIAQVQGSQTETVAFKVWALNTTLTDAGVPDRNPAGPDDGWSDAAPVTITEVTVIGYAVGQETPVTLDLSTVPDGTWAAVAYGIYVRENPDGSVTFTGVQEGDQYGINTGDVNQFNAVAVQGQPTNTGPVGNQSTADDFDLGVFSLGEASSGDPIELSFDVLATDADGDTSTGTIDVTLVPPTVVPVILDLDGDGVEFVGTEAGVLYDYNGDGLLESTAWVGADDGILAYDANGDGQVSGASEFVFGGNGLTDLEALAAHYDTNGDGVLNAMDDGWAQFGVWQDADQDGVADDGEFTLLGDLGINEIALVSDGDAYIAANGDVQVAGSATFTRSDGTTGELADAAFATRQTQLTSIAAAAGALTLSADDDTQVVFVPSIDEPASQEPMGTPEVLAPQEEDGETSTTQSQDLLGSEDGQHGDEPPESDLNSDTSDDGTGSSLASVSEPVDTGEIDSGDETEPSETDGGPIDTLGNDMTVMDALLLAAEDSGSEDGSTPAEDDAVTEQALQEVQDESVIDHLLDGLLGSAEVSDAPANDDTSTGLLDMMTSDGTTHFMTMDTNSVDDDLSALAAAAQG